MGSPPRITPGDRGQIGLVNSGIARIAGRVTGTGPPNVMTTLGRNRRLFRRWLFFAGALMPGGKLPREHTELVILRVAHNCGSDYEWGHHEHLGRRAGLTAEEIGRVREGPEAEGWTPAQVALLRAADALHADRDVSDELFSELRGHFSEKDLIEVFMLIGHYEMLAMTLNSLRVQPERAA
jgi:alkylhydroperoxidase family enzyme